MVDPKLNSDELSHLLTMSGLEVEEVEPVAPPFSNVVVAQVKEVAKHPNADRLNVCQVDVGTGTLLNIVCGAPVSADTSRATPSTDRQSALFGVSLIVNFRSFRAR